MGMIIKMIALSKGSFGGGFVEIGLLWAGIFTEKTTLLLPSFWFL